MVNYEDALAIAREKKRNVEICTEYENAFVFGSKNPGSIGGDSPVVILKETGEAVNFLTWAVMPKNPEPVRKEFEV